MVPLKMKYIYWCAKTKRGFAKLPVIKIKPLPV